MVDFKPDLHFDPNSESLSKHAVNAFPQLIAYALTIQKQLEGTGLEVKCLMFNGEASIEFDPNLMFYPVFDFMTNLQFSRWSEKLTDNVLKVSDISNSYHGTEDDTDSEWGYKNIQAKDSLLKFFIDFYEYVNLDDAKIEALLRGVYGNDFELYKQAFLAKIEQIRAHVLSSYLPP